MRLVLALLLAGCAWARPKDRLEASTVELYGVDGAWLDPHKIDTVIGVASSIMGLQEFPTIYLRKGSNFQCLGQDVVGCTVNTDTAVAAENEKQCPYAILAHELGHYFAWVDTNGDGDGGHTRPDIWGADGYEHQIKRAIASLCEWHDGAWR